MAILPNKDALDKLKKLRDRLFGSHEAEDTTIRVKEVKPAYKEDPGQPDQEEPHTGKVPDRTVSKSPGIGSL